RPVEKRRALGRGLDSLLPSGPRIVTASSAASGGTPAVPLPVVIPPAAPGVAPAPAKAEPAEIAEIHAVQERLPREGSSETSSAAGSAPVGAFDFGLLGNSHFSQNRGELGHPKGPNAAPSLAGSPAPHAQEIAELPLELIDENPYQTRQTFDPEALKELAESI